MEYNKNTPVDTTLVSSLPKEIRDKGESLKELIDEVEIGFDAHKAESESKHITESGGNTNGSYIKFDDGTMICRGSKLFTDIICNIEYRGGFRGSVLNNVIVFPSSFINNTISFATIPKFEVVGAISLLRGELSITEARVAPFALISSDAITFRVDYIALGRWK